MRHAHSERLARFGVTAAVTVVVPDFGSTPRGDDGGGGGGCSSSSSTTPRPKPNS